MTTQTIRKLLDAAPFQPFKVHLSDGRVVPVRHREFAMVSPADLDFVVYQPDGDIDIIATGRVTGVKLEAKSRRSSAK